jgi:hypothetical protein
MRKLIRRCGIEKANYRQCRLLRARNKRPGDRSTE